MKKSVLTICLLLTLVTGTANVQQVYGTIPLESGIVDPTEPYNPYPKMPPQAPSLWQEGHEIYFQSSHPDYSIDIVQSGIVVYSVDVDATTTSVVLPSWLSGEYALQLYPDGTNYYYYGFIYL